ncbi:MAG: CoA transferase subunit A [Gemmatimonadetes bacterium]|nr:CoA transferase subunit A [Gemmatimonadota bacterium]
MGIQYDPAEMIAGIPDGARIMMGGFGMCGIPENSIAMLLETGQKNLTILSNNAGVDTFGIGLLINSGQVSKMISTYIGENTVLEKLLIDGGIEVELVPQGTFAERIRAAGAGLGGFFTPTGVGTVVAEGKETRELHGKTFVFEEPLHADYAFVKASVGDRKGNLFYRKTTQNFNAVMAMAAKKTIAEVEKLVDAGGIEPESVHTPGLFVDVVYQGANFEKRIEKRTYRTADR